MGLVYANHGSAEFNTWGRRCSALTEADLSRGLDACAKHTRDKGKLTLPTFLGYCRNVSKPVESPIKSVADMRERGGPRFRELMKVTDAMLAEAGDGPITLATKNGKLTPSAIRDKSAEEIIQFCHELYG